MRIRNIRSALRDGPIAGRLRWRAGRHAEIDELVHLHDPAYVEEVREFCLGGGGVLAWSTRVCEGSWPASLAAAGTALEATRAVLDGECTQSYALVRPPGHHAQPATADGYCLFTTRRWRRTPRRTASTRVAIIDWDVHHGNGTQDALLRARGRADDLRAHAARLVGWPTPAGSRRRRGRGAGEGHNVNIELGSGRGNGGYWTPWSASSSRSSVSGPTSVIVASGRTRTSTTQRAPVLDMAGFRRLGSAATSRTGTAGGC